MGRRSNIHPHSRYTNPNRKNTSINISFTTTEPNESIILFRPPIFCDANLNERSARIVKDDGGNTNLSSNSLLGLHDFQEAFRNLSLEERNG